MRSGRALVYVNNPQITFYSNDEAKDLVLFYYSQIPMVMPTMGPLICTTHNIFTMHLQIGLS